MDSNIISIYNRLKDGSITHFKDKLEFSSQENNNLQFICLLTKKEISSTPVRGVECKHLESYDENYLKEYLNENESLQCLKCGKYIYNDNIVPDLFLWSIMKYNPREKDLNISIKKS